MTEERNDLLFPALVWRRMDFDRTQAPGRDWIDHPELREKTQHHPDSKKKADGFLMFFPPSFRLTTVALSSRAVEDTGSTRSSTYERTS